MGANTKIEWADHTFNPWIGCTRVSPGCDHCYAAVSTPARTRAVQWGAGEPRQRTTSTWSDPKRWNDQHAAFFAEHGRRQRVFCASLADWLDKEVPVEWLVDLLEVIRTTRDLDWMLLTKRIGYWRARIELALGYLAERGGPERAPLIGWLYAWFTGEHAPRNVWIGATIVNQPEADRDIPKLLAVNARVRFLSMEPLLGPPDILKWLDPFTCADCEFHGSENDCGPDGCEKCGQADAFADGNTCKSCGADDQAAKRSCPRCGSHRSFERDAGFKFDSEQKLIDWVIVGGESGHGARPMHPDWARSLRDQCAAAGVSFLFKQWGEFAPEGTADQRTLVRADGATRAMDAPVGIGYHEPREGAAFMYRVGKKAAGRLLDGRTHDEFPDAFA